jgi:hypothetical protein
MKVKLTFSDYGPLYRHLLFELELSFKETKWKLTETLVLRRDEGHTGSKMFMVA